jgi:hypothetical protein
MGDWAFLPFLPLVRVVFVGGALSTWVPDTSLMPGCRSYHWAIGPLAAQQQLPQERDLKLGATHSQPGKRFIEVNA